MTKTLYGPHLMEGAYNYREMLRNMQPAISLMLHPKAEDVAILKEESPDTQNIGRLYLPDNTYSEGIKTRPVEFANEIHTQIMSTDWWDKVDFVQSNNEVMQSYHWVDGSPPGELERLATYTQEWMRLADGRYSVAYGAFSVTRPDIPKGWPLFYDTMRQGMAGGHLLLLHEYGWPDFWSPPGKWHMGKFAERVWPTLPADLKAVEFALGEFGYDRLIENVKGGWRSTDLKPAEVATQLQNYHFDFNTWRQKGMHFLGAAMFSVGDLGWEDYNFAHGGNDSPLAHYISFLPEVVAPIADPPIVVPPDPPIVIPPEPPIIPPEPPIIPPEPPIIPPVIPGDQMIEIIDGNGNPQTWEWLIEKYGEPFHSRIPANEKGFHVYRIQANETGESSVKVDVRKESGRPADNNVSFWWADAPIQVQGCATQPYNRFIHQSTGSNGLTAFAFGTGAYYLPPDTGYHKIWVCSSLPSDVVNAGMLANTNHYHLDFFYGISEGESPIDPPVDPEPPVIPPGDGTLDAILAEIRKLSYHLGVR